MSTAPYDRGGWITPGWVTVVNNTAKPEPVISPSQPCPEGQ